MLAPPRKDPHRNVSQSAWEGRRLWRGLRSVGGVLALEKSFELSTQLPPEDMN